jgi:hypothetical protein
VVGGLTQTATSAAPLGSGTTRQISSSGTVVFRNTPSGVDGLQNPEIRAQGDGAGGAPATGHLIVPGKSGGHDSARGDGQGANSPATTLANSFDGINHRQHRLANGGNQFSLEPPDQGLCVSGTHVLETVNDAVRVYDKTGKPVTAVQDLNTFLGYPAAIIRGAKPAFGPFVTDPSCLFDTATQRWFLDVLTIDTNPATGSFTGGNHIDIAVSKTADPTGAWTVYRVPVQDDGTQGTPDHGCSATPAGTGHGPCFGDYPHIGADSNGFYVTTNEYSMNGPEYHAAQIYAFSKQALVSGASKLTMVQYDTIGLDNGNPGFTVWPATSPAGAGSPGTEYFLSSNAGDEAQPNYPNPGTRQSDQLLVWALTNTGALKTGRPPLLSHTPLPVETYAFPPQADQKPGPAPLRDCLNDIPCSTFLLGTPTPTAPEVLGRLDSNDTRMQQVTYANGLLYGALDTSLSMDGVVSKAGIAWFVVKPSVEEGSVTAELHNQGYLGLRNNNLTYPAIGVTSSGEGVMAFTVVGRDYYPSAGYASLNADSGTGKVKIAAQGVGPDDGFSNYKAFGNPVRSRWGDYGAAVPDGNSVWLASEYIGQRCTLAQYEATPFGSCGGTRTSLANWGTRISQVAVSPNPQD